MRKLAFAALLCVGCNNAPPAPPPVPGTIAAQGEAVVTVNGTQLTQNMVDAVTLRIPSEQLEQMKEMPGQMDRFYEQLALGQILYEKAITEDLHEDELVKAGLAMAAREFLAGVYVQRKGEAAISDAAVQAFYDERAVQFARPQVRARHILVKEESLAADLKKQLEDGADFAALAQQHSRDTGSAQRGGDLGWFEDGRMVEEFSKAAFGAETNAIVGPVSTRFGFHIIQVTDKRDKTPLEEVRPQIVSELRQKAIEELIEEARSSMVLEKPTSAEAQAMPAGHPPVPPQKPAGHP